MLIRYCCNLQIFIVFSESSNSYPRHQLTYLQSTIGTTIHKFVDGCGNDIYLPCVSYHLPETDVRLFSPQTYHHIYGGHSIVNGDEVIMRICYKNKLTTLAIPINHGGTNLPIVRDSFVSNNMKKKLANQFRFALIAIGVNIALDYFANVSVHRVVSTSSRLRGIFSSFPCVGGHENENLSMPQKELLLWHWKLGVGMQRVQSVGQTQPVLPAPCPIL